MIFHRINIPTVTNTIGEPGKQDSTQNSSDHIQQKQTDENKEAVYYVDFVAKGTNSFGGIIQSKYSATVLNDENLTVLSISKND